MNRRQFVSRVSLGAAAACTTFAKPSLAATTAGQLNFRFVGMMGFIQRADHSFLVATPGQHGTHHMTHVPFLMARKGSPVAKALGFAPISGVVPEAFDTTLIDSRPEDFVYRSLSNAAVDVVSGSDAAVENEATEMAQMNLIAPGKRIRGNIEKWAASTISLRGGRLENSSGHPDAGKVWSFGQHKQRLTDAINFRNIRGEATTIRLTSATEVRNYNVAPSESLDLWMFSAATMDAQGGSPTRLGHSELLFEYLVDANPVYAECPEAIGRTVPMTEVPFVNPSSAGLGFVSEATRFPPESELCYPAVFLQIFGIVKQ
jgi:hypothetical protein